MIVFFQAVDLNENLCLVKYFEKVNTPEISIVVHRKHAL